MSDHQPLYRAYTTRFDTETGARDLAAETGADLASLGPLPQADRVAVPPLPAHFGPRPMATLLVDHSGSLRDGPERWAAGAVVAAGRMLEAAGMALDVLGFTTASWQGGQSRRAWEAQGRPLLPGRLCDLLHIVYRDAGAPDPSWALAMPLMCDPYVLKENVDGEALEWAFRRAMAARPSYWICILVSDGAPADDSTIDANMEDSSHLPSPLLSAHLDEVARRIDLAPNTQMAAFYLYRDAAELAAPIAGPFEDRGHALTDTDDPSALAAFIAGLIAAEG